VLWQNPLRYISRTELNDIADSARMYELAEAALADAQIACFESNYLHKLWSPITPIRHGDQEAIPPPTTILVGSHLSIQPIFPSTPSVTPPLVRFLIC
jgi:hypothetical protein